MPKFCVMVHGGMFEIDDAIDEDDAREQALEQVDVDVELEEVEVEEEEEEGNDDDEDA